MLFRSQVEAPLIGCLGAAAAPAVRKQSLPFCVPLSGAQNLPQNMTACKGLCSSRKGAVFAQLARPVRVSSPRRPSCIPCCPCPSPAMAALVCLATAAARCSNCRPQACACPSRIFLACRRACGPRRLPAHAATGQPWQESACAGASLLASEDCLQLGAAWPTRSHRSRSP